MNPETNQCQEHSTLRQTCQCVMHKREAQKDCWTDVKRWLVWYKKMSVQMFIELYWVHQYLGLQACWSAFVPTWFALLNLYMIPDFIKHLVHNNKVCIHGCIYSFSFIFCLFAVQWDGRNDDFSSCSHQPMLKGTFPACSGTRTNRLTQGPLMSKCKHYMNCQKVSRDVIIVKLIVTSSYGEVSGPCAQLNRVDTPNSPNFGL